MCEYEEKFAEPIQSLTRLHTMNLLEGQFIRPRNMFHETVLAVGRVGRFLTLCKTNEK